MRKALLESYLDRTTFQYRNKHPRETGLMETISSIVEREGSWENLPKSLNKIHEYHRLIVDRSRVKNDDEAERIATMMTLSVSMMIFNKHLSSRR